MAQCLLHLVFVAFALFCGIGSTTSEENRKLQFRADLKNNVQLGAEIKDDSNGAKSIYNYEYYRRYSQWAGTGTCMRKAWLNDPRFLNRTASARDSTSMAPYAVHLPKDWLKETVYNERQAMVGFILRNYKIVMCPLPKAGCTQMKSLALKLEGYDDYHTRFPHAPKYYTRIYDVSREEMEQIGASKQWTKMILVRNPYTRLLSGYLDKVIKERAPYKPITRAYLNTVGRNQPSFATFVKMIVQTQREPLLKPETVTLDHRVNRHYRRQSSVCAARLLEYDVILHYETFKEDVKKYMAYLGLGEHVETGWGPNKDKPFLTYGTKHATLKTSTTTTTTTTTTTAITTSSSRGSGGSASSAEEAAAAVTAKRAAEAKYGLARRYYSQQTRDMVRKYYMEDFLRFGYDPEGADVFGPNYTFPSTPSPSHSSSHHHSSSSSSSPPLVGRGRGRGGPGGGKRKQLMRSNGNNNNSGNNRNSINNNFGRPRLPYRPDSNVL